MKSYYADFYDDNGEYLERVKFSINKDTFRHRGKSYVIDLKASYRKWTDFIFFKKFCYVYNINNPAPMHLKEKREFLLSAKDLDTLLESKLARELNAINNNFLADLLSPKNIIIGAVVLTAILFFMGKI